MARKYLGVIMAAMGLLQLATWTDFIDALVGNDIGGRGVVSVLGAVIIAGELTAAVGLFTRRSFGPLVSTVVMVIWTALAVQAFTRGLSLDNCGCFGRFFAQKLRWWVLLEDVYLLGLSAWLVRKFARNDADEADRSGQATLEPAAA